MLTVANSNQSQDLEHLSHKNHDKNSSLLNESNNSSEFQKKKLSHSLKNALKTLGGFFQSGKKQRIMIRLAKIKKTQLKTTKITKYRLSAQR